MCNISFGHDVPLTPVLALHDANGNKMVPWHSLGPYDWNEVKHDFSVISCLWHWCHFRDVDGIINSTTAFHMSRQLKWHPTWHFGLVQQLASIMALLDATEVGDMWCHCISVSIMWCGQHINSTIPSLRSWWSKWCATWLLNHVTLLALAQVSCDANSSSLGPLHFLGQDNWKEVQYEILVIWSSLAPLNSLC